MKLVNNQYIPDSISAEDINISPEMFSFYKANLEEMNASAREQMAKGGNIEISPIDEKYLKSLLDDKEIK